MRRITNIIAIKVEPRTAVDSRPLSVRCLRGKAKWLADGTLAMTADVSADALAEDWLGALKPQSPPFDLEINCQEGAQSGHETTTRFENCTNSEIEVESATARPKGPSSLRYHLKLKAGATTETLKVVQ